MVQNNIQQLSTFLFSLGAHIGHIRVDSHHSLSPFLAGERNYFMIIDMQRTIPMLKKALVFYSEIISSFGHSVFCYSCVDMLNIYLKTYFANMISARNQSFSSWRWAPGCVTNYRFVFLRLVTFLFSDVRVKALRDTKRLRKAKRYASYTSSFMCNYRKLWLLFLMHNKVTLRNVCDFPQLRAQFNSFFLQRKNILLHKFLSKSSVRRKRFEFAQTASNLGIIDNNTMARIKWRLRSRTKYKRKYVTRSYGGRFRVLPNFISLLLRLCYIIRNKFKSVLADNAHMNEDSLFLLLYTRLLAFWRAVIFFRFFRKTATLPDCLVMLNPDNSIAEFNDFLGVRLPIICVADTNTDISKITYPIPSNDDSIVLLVFYFMLFLNACDSGQATRAAQILA